MRSWSLRRRLVLGLTALVGVGLVVVGFVVVLILRGYLVGQIDQQLTQPRRFGQTDTSATTACFDRRQSPTTPPVTTPPTTTEQQNPQLPSSFAVIILNADGTVETSFGGSLIQDAGPDLTGFTASYVQGLQEQIVTVPGQNGGSSYRVKATSCTINGTASTQVVALSLAPVDSTIRSLVIAIAVVSVIVLLLLILLAQVVVRVGLRPLDDVEDTAEAIAAGDLTRRVPDAPPGTEVGRLSSSLNGMLGQIEKAFAEREASEGRLRRFVGDASHELRTPLTSIRGYAELFRQGALRDPVDESRALRAIEDEASRMGVLVDELLLLARLDQQRPLEREPVQLAALVEDAVAAARVRDPLRTIESVTVADDGADDLDPDLDVGMVIGDPARLRQVLDNLLGNALQHTSSASDVLVRLIPTTDAVRLTVADKGPGMTPDQVSHVFERFYRADPARTRGHGGSGLGLSLVDAVVSAHGGSVQCESTVSGGTTISVELPRSGAQGA